MRVTSEIPPAIHLFFEADVDAEMAQWVELGAEEEGVPVVRFQGRNANTIAAAYEAAQASLLGVGIGIGSGIIVLHESHMAREQPVLVAKDADFRSTTCRRFGANAARMVVGLPLHFDMPEKYEGDGGKIRPLSLETTREADGDKLHDVPTGERNGKAPLDHIVEAIVSELKRQGGYHGR